MSDIYDSSKDEAPGNDYYSVAYYVNMYVENLQNLGFTGVNSGRILAEADVSSGGIYASYKASGEDYWLSTAVGSANIRIVGSGGGIGTVTYSNASIGVSGGVRPVIYISTSDIQ